MRIGLLGGSFNPPHAAHRAISLFALKRLQLDRVWWLVTPGNPLKDTRELPPLDERPRAREAGRRSAHRCHRPRSCHRYALHCRYDRHLRRRISGVRFVWLMGADNLAQFHRWKSWRRIAVRVPIAVIDRPPESFRALPRPRPRRWRVTGCPRIGPPSWPTRRAGLGFPDRHETELSSTAFGTRTAAGRQRSNSRSEVRAGFTGILKPLTPHA